jgi:predicted transcriptional regulator
MTTQTKQITISTAIKEDLLEELKQHSQKSDRHIAYILRKALEEFLEKENLKEKLNEKKMV